MTDVVEPRFLRFSIEDCASLRAAASTILKLRDRRVAEAGDLGEPLGAGGQRLGVGAEAGDQRLGDRLHVAARHGAEQNQLEQLVVGERRRAALAEALAQALAVAGVVRLDERIGVACHFCSSLVNRQMAKPPKAPAICGRKAISNETPKYVKTSNNTRKTTETGTPFILLFKYCVSKSNTANVGMASMTHAMPVKTAQSGPWSTRRVWGPNKAKAQTEAGRTIVPSR